MQDVVEDDGAGGTGEGMFAGRHLVEHGAQREKVAAAVGLFGACLLWRHVGDGSDRSTRAREHATGVDNGFTAKGVVAVVEQFGETKIENFQCAAFGDKNVRGLDVAVNDALLVGSI